MITTTAVLSKEPVKLIPQLATWMTTEPLTVRIAAESAASMAGPTAYVMEHGRVVAVVTSPSQADAVGALADELAFQIISSDSQLAAIGITRSWEAFRSFKQGLDNFQRFLEIGDLAALSNAIEQFRDAARKDPAFALANYRLGLALQYDGQPGAAAEAFRASLSSNSRFTAAYNALAYHLYYFDRSYPGTAAAVPSAVPVGDDLHENQAAEARRLWQQVLTLPSQFASAADRASAYYGLCTDALDRADRIEPDFADDRAAQRAVQDNYSLAYFYCQQAERLYAVLAAELRSDPLIKQGEASALNNMGVILSRSRAEYTEKRYTVGQALPWHCAGDAIEVDRLAPDGWIIRRSLQHGPYARQALGYYEQALALQPDDPVLRCNRASVASVLGDPQPMQTLEGNIFDHLALARSYADEAKKYVFSNESQRIAVGYYRLALAEYQAMIDRDPTNVLALNNYAYTFWEWRVNLPDARPPDGPSRIIAAKAEDYACTAVRFVADKRQKSDEAIYRGTLGEVLLGLGRADKAVEELEHAAALAPAHAQYDEIRWDLAQAYLCAAVQSGRLQPVRDVNSSKLPDADELRKRAEIYLEQIRNNEQLREFQPFSGQPDLLDTTKVPKACFDGPQYERDIGLVASR